MKKALTAVLIVLLALFMVACDSNPNDEQTPPPMPNDFENGLIDVKYEEDFLGLISLLNSIGGFDNLVAGEESTFNIMGINIGSIILNDYVDNNNFSYDATFKEGTKTSRLVTVTIGPDIAIKYSIVDGKSAFSADIPENGSSLKVVVGEQNYIVSELPFDVTLENDGTVKVGSNSYTASEANVYGSVAEVLDKIKENMTADESDLVGSEEENAYSYSFRKTVVSETEINCNGTVVIGKLSVPVSFTIGKTSETDVWSFSEISIDSKKISDNTVNKINDPYIVM